jgi:hypothetical protein
MTKYTNEVVEELELFFKKNKELTRTEYKNIKRICYKIAYGGK